MKKLPELYKNEKINFVDHNRKVYTIKEEKVDKEENILDDIFNGIGHPYNQKVFIKTSKKTYETYLVSRTKQNVLTLENEVIPIQDILYIKKIDSK